MSTANQNALFLFKWPFLLTLCGLPPVGMVPLLLVGGTGCLRKVNPEMKGRGWGQASVSPRVLPGGAGRGESKADKGINISLRRVSCERLALNGGFRGAACSSERDTETVLLLPASYLAGDFFCKLCKENKPRSHVGWQRPNYPDAKERAAICGCVANDSRELVFRELIKGTARQVRAALLPNYLFRKLKRARKSHLSCVCALTLISLLDGKAASGLKTHPGLGEDPQLDAGGLHEFWWESI